MKTCLAVLGSMAAEGPLVHWVSNHRKHHRFHDQSGDPHSPYVKNDRRLYGFEGLIHSHIGWLFNSHPANPVVFSKDLLRDAHSMQLNKLYFVWVLVGLLIPTLLAGLVDQSLEGALRGFLWGGLVRIFFTHHITWSVNSLCHKYGKASFISQDRSTNLPWLSLLTVGGSFHNNHHAFPYSSTNALEHKQFDLGYWVLLRLRSLGLVHELRRPSTESILSNKL